MCAELALFAWLTSAVMAQGSTPGTLLNSTIDPSLVDNTTKIVWCKSQQMVCNNLCDNTNITNTCEYASLEFDCLCGNGSTPGLQYYQGSLDTFICQYNYKDCISAAASNASQQNICIQNANQNCGVLQLPADVQRNDTNPGTSTGAPTATASSSSSSSGLSSGARAGIGVGVAIGGVLLIALIVFLVYSYRLRKANEAKRRTQDGIIFPELDGEVRKGELSGETVSGDQVDGFGTMTAQEMDGVALRSELAGDDATEMEARSRQQVDVKVP